MTEEPSVAMRRYYFNVRDGVTTLDEVGEEHPSLEAAKRAAVESLAEILRFHDQIWDGETLVIEVLGPDHNVVARVTAGGQEFDS